MCNVRFALDKSSKIVSSLRYETFCACALFDANSAVMNFPAFLIVYFGIRARRKGTRRIITRVQGKGWLFPRFATIGELLS
jgi:hypothetical protein